MFCFVRRNVHTTYFFLSISFHLFVENVVDIRRQLLKLEDQDQWNMDKKLTKRQCQAIYPDGTDGSLFFELQMKFLSRAKAEKFLYACNYDFAIANELSALCHFNFFFLMNIIEHFGGDYKEACLYLRNVRNSQSRNQTTTHCKTALEILQSFRGNGTAASGLLEKFGNDSSKARTFLTKFDNNGEETSSFLSSFENNVEKANDFLHKFNDSGINANEYLKKFINIAEGETFLQRFNDGNKANEYLKKFKNVNEASELLSKFIDEDETNEFLRKFDDNRSKANEFIREFNGSLNSASQFIKSFNNSKEALEHLEKIKRECDKKQIILVEITANGFSMRRQKRCSSEEEGE